ncbi:MAG: hypothetical protein WAK55_08330, partial [Xanthobacteraceae bacterium]
MHESAGDWLTWPADQLLRIGGFVAAWFFSEDATGFTLVQMGFATLVLATLVGDVRILASAGRILPTLMLHAPVRV